MILEAYVISSIVLSVLVVAAMYRSDATGFPSLRCLRCGAEMVSEEGGVGCIGMSRYRVVPPILVIKCPQCGYEEGCWACPGD
jgi:hypothetical protein